MKMTLFSNVLFLLLVQVIFSPLMGSVLSLPPSSSPYSSNPTNLSIHCQSSNGPSVAQALPLRVALTASADGEDLTPLQEP